LKAKQFEMSLIGN